MIFFFCPHIWQHFYLRQRFFFISGADNWPLRGSKGTLWEGGTRGTAFIYSQSWLNKTGYTYNGLFHAVDWYPTILSAAAGNKANVNN